MDILKSIVTANPMASDAVILSNIAQEMARLNLDYISENVGGIQFSIENDCHGETMYYVDCDESLVNNFISALHTGVNLEIFG